MQSDLERIVRESVQDVIQSLDLPRRKDIEALSLNFDRVATAVERLQRAYLPDDDVPTQAAAKK
ncbi:MAG: hypothetical protein H8E78_02050 [Proteobacteria bacterium]|nr:hypothetical protein [Pseudomonadota bacterium]